MQIAVTTNQIVLTRSPRATASIHQPSTPRAVMTTQVAMRLGVQVVSILVPTGTPALFLMMSRSSSGV